MKWFDKSKLHTVAELRTAYKELLKIHHPDNGGNVSDMQEINSEYDTLYSILSQKESADGESCTEQENAADEAFRAILNEIAGFNMTVEVIGNWLWCFDCFQYKDRLKELGFKWAAKKRAWIWHSEPYHRHHKGEIPLDKIKERYGCKTVRNHSRQYAID